MIWFIEDHRADHGVEPICRVLPIAPATFYDHLAKRADPSRLSDRAKRDEELKPEIERVFEENLSVYGVRKVWHQMRREGFDIARCTVARLMKDIGIEGVVRGKKPKTTIPDKALPCPLDKVNRQFHAPAPNVLWVSDFTYVATWQGFVYVAARPLSSDQWRTRSCSLMSSPVVSLGGASVARPRPDLSSTLWNRLFINAGQHRINWCITRIAGRNICRSSIPSAWQRQKSPRRSAVSATVTTTLWPKRSTACSRQKSFTDVAHGADLPPEAPSFIMRVCGFGFHILRRQFGQARRAWSPQIAQASGALLRVSGFLAMSAA